MWGMRALLLAVLLLTWQAGAVAQSIYRCTDAKGQPVFQQHPCEPGAGGRVEVRPINTVDGDPDGDRTLRAQAARGQAVDLAIARGQVREGMTDAEMSQVMGQPTAVNTSVVNGQVSRQYVYRYPDGSTRYVYTRDGEVWAGQHQEPLRRRATEPCYGAQEIANQRTTASSVTASPAARQAAERQLEVMLGCKR